MKNEEPPSCPPWGMIGYALRLRSPNCVSAIFHFSLFTFHSSLKEEPAPVSAALPADMRRIRSKNPNGVSHSSFFILHLEHSSFLKPDHAKKKNNPHKGRKYHNRWR